MLTNPEVVNDSQTGKPWTDSAVAKKCHVDHKTVAAVKASLGISQVTERAYTTKHGTTAVMNTARIGRKESTSAGVVDAPDDRATLPRSSSARSGRRGRYCGRCRRRLVEMQ